MKFKYRGDEHDLTEIVGKENLPKAETGDDHIITKDGMKLLMQHFPYIDCTFGPLQAVKFDGSDHLALEACAYNKMDGDTPYGIGRSFGEISVRNADGEFGLRFPICTLENRARNRAMLRHLGITGLVSEEELAPDRENQYDKSTTEEETPPKEIDPEKPSQEIIKLNREIKEFASTLNLSNEKRLDVYREVLENKELEVNEIKGKMTPEVMKEVHTRLKKRVNASR
jgi:hypothetical protein